MIKYALFARFEAKPGKESAVDDEQVPGDKTRCLGGQENGGSDQFLDSSEPMHGRAQQELLPARSAVQQRCIQVCSKNPGHDGIHTHSVSRPFHRQRFCKRSDPGLARRVGRYFEHTYKR